MSPSAPDLQTRGPFRYNCGAGALALPSSFTFRCLSVPLYGCNQSINQSMILLVLQLTCWISYNKHQRWTVTLKNAQQNQRECFSESGSCLAEQSERSKIQPLSLSSSVCATTLYTNATFPHLRWWIPQRCVSCLALINLNSKQLHSSIDCLVMGSTSSVSYGNFTCCHVRSHDEDACAFRRTCVVLRRTSSLELTTC